MVQEIHCKTADELLDELNPRRGRAWRISNQRQEGSAWIFRGGGDARYELQPSAFRPNAFVPFIPAQVKLTENDPKRQRAVEAHVVAEFCSQADRAGIEIPGDRPELRDPRCAPDENPFEFPPISQLHMFALAQHHGIPTRLLDWTIDPLVAAYFAVREAAMKRACSSTTASDDSACAIWALDRGRVETLKGNDSEIRFVTAPHASNPNLHAQRGLFTLVQPVSGDPHPLPTLDTVLRGLQAPPDYQDYLPLLYKFTLPDAEAGVMLQFLRDLGVDAARITPGLDGVATAMREVKYCRRPEVADADDS